MKVTAIISSSLIEDVKAYSKGKNLTECLHIALREWVASKKIKELNKSIKKKPLVFLDNNDLQKIRKQNRKSK